MNLQLVASGHAFVYRQYLKSPCSPGAYLKAEEAAQAARVGVWSVAGGITRPWDFRHGLKRSSTPTSSSGGRSGGGTHAAQSGTGPRPRNSYARVMAT